eukprot:CAMPEP_0115840320 /NCGR_PEP_ID=MMETSP0287-20121206/6709_1 /TAXON_ID=412157 /ORGANISM="Chrysochromulina rotalis, Strain UIO044" /LENGTH=327 /DNA_ID=CAMNT_0003293925 /DNA_START=174 /DNA_END=1157 /DNA_ORIENTATION=-
MAGVSGGLLAAATARAGALGFIAAGHLDNVGKLREEVRIFRAEAPSGSPLAIGFIGFSSMRDGLRRVEAAITEHRPSVVQFFAPAVVGENIQLAQSMGAFVMAQVGCEHDAKEAMIAGADAIIAQGQEAGGHGLRAPLGSSTFPLAAQVVRLAEQASTARPIVLAAGGIVDGRGLAAALALGCDGAIFGTRLWASTESLGHRSFKHALTTASPDDVARTTVFDQVQNTYRGAPWPQPFDSSGALLNETAKKWLDRPVQLAEELARRGSELALEHRQAEGLGDVSQSCVFAGEGVGGITSIESAEVLLKSAEADAAAQINLLQRLLVA